jgi:hypothetical protein
MAVEVERRLDDVFGVSRAIPLTYVTRPEVDDQFINSLARAKHIVIYGGSKQGKTCLRRNCLKPEDAVTIQCSNTATRAQIYEMLLKEAGASVEVTTKKAVSGSAKVSLKFAEIGGTKGQEATHKSFEIDPLDPNDVIRVLKGINFKRFVVLEDFHYLAEEVQRDIAVDLKAFHEQSDLSFIVVGVWLESDRLVLYNGDLAGRLIPIDADKWTKAQLKEVISVGESLLNVHFTNETKEALVEQCQFNVGLMQEACHKLCSDAGILKTQPTLTQIGSEPDVRRIVAGLAARHASRYENFLQQFGQGFQDTELRMYRWIAYTVVTASPAELKRGLKSKTIYQRLNELHSTHKGKLYQNNVEQALKNISKLQHNLKVQPTIFDYDVTERTLRVADSGLIVYLNSVTEEQALALLELEMETPKALPPAPEEDTKE